MRVIETKDEHGGTIVEIQSSIDPSGITLSDDPQLSATLQLTSPTLSCVLSGGTRSLSATLQRSGPPAEYYDGIYDVRPTVEDQSLPTKDKLLYKDVNVEAIPYFETTNESGGYTVIIG